MQSKEAKRNEVDYLYTGLNWDFIKLMAQIAKYAEGKYSRAENYVDSRLIGEKSPINHIYEHLRLYQTREAHDHFGTLSHQLAAIAYNALMEYYYLVHAGGPTVSCELYRPMEVSPVADAPEPDHTDYRALQTALEEAAQTKAYDTRENPAGQVPLTYESVTPTAWDRLTAGFRPRP